jgi:hypothetical protein
MSYADLIAKARALVLRKSNGDISPELFGDQAQCTLAPLASALEAAEIKLGKAREALDKIEDWRPSSATYCQGCYCETESMARKALAEIDK